MTIKQNIPKLRFKEFSGEWEEKKLGEIGEIVSGGTPETLKSEYWGGNIQWFTPTELKTKYVFNSNRTISDLGLKKSSAKILPKNTILLSSRATIGDVSIALNECTTNQGFQSIIVNYKNDFNFFYFLIRNNKKELIKKASGSTFLEISKTEISKLKFFKPQLPEQQKVSSFLSSIDEKIEKIKEKKKLLEEYKKGVMQKIFSQEIRFKDENGEEFGEWEEKKLGDLAKITTGKLDANAMVENGKYRFYTCAKDYFKIDDYAFDTEALLISGNGANVGYIHYYKGKFNAYQRTYILDGFSENITYIKYFLEKNLSQRIGAEKNEGNTPYIVMGTLADFNINLPPIKEQEKIADFLSGIDEKVEKISEELDKMEEFKKGLLQNMFV